MNKLFLVRSAVLLIAGIASFFVITSKYESIQLEIQLEESYHAMDYAQDLISGNGEFQVVSDELYAGAVSLHESEIVDYVEHYTGFGCTIFKNNVRISTTIKAENSEEVGLGTKASEKITKLVFEEGNEFEGIIESSGRDWLIHYKPLKGRNDKIVGMIGVFKDWSVFQESFVSFRLIVGTTIFTLVGFLIFMMYRSDKKNHKLIKVQTDLMTSNAGLIEQRSQTELLSIVVQNTQQSVIIASDQDVIEWVNPAFEDMFGYTSQEVVGRKISAVLGGPKTNVKTVQEINKSLFEDKKPIDVTVVNYNKKREDFWTKAFITPILDDNGFLTKYVTTSTNISNEKVMQDKLSQSESNFRQISETISDVFYLYNIRDKQYEFISNNCLEIMGASPDFFYDGKKHTDKFVHSHDKEALYEANKKVDAGEPYDIEYRVIIKGETRWLRERSFPIENKYGDVVKNSGVVSDITAQKNIDKEIEQSFLNNKVMAELGFKITEELNVKKIVQFTHEKLVELMDAESFAIGTINETKNELEFPYFIDKFDYFEKIGYSLDANILANICIKTKKDIIILDFENEIETYTGEPLDNKHGDLPSSVIYLPVLSKGIVIGVITVQSSKKNAYTMNQVEILRGLSVYVSNALTNATNYEHLEKEVELRTIEVSKQKDALEMAYNDSQLLAEIGIEIASSVELEDVFDKLYKNVNQLIDAEVFGIRMLDKEAGEVEYRYEIESGHRDEIMRISMDDKDNYTVWCIENKKEVFINNNAEEYSNYVKEIKVPAGKMPSSLIFCPIMYNKEVIGAVTVQSFKSNAYDDRALVILKALSSYCGIAYANAQLVSDLQEKLDKKA